MFYGMIVLQMLGQTGLTPEKLYDSLTLQADQGSWSRGFDKRAFDEDPWNIGVFDPTVVHFEAPETQKDRVVELRETLFNVVRPILITDKAWDQLLTVLHAVYTNPDIEKYVREHGANIFLATPHTMFADLGITAGGSHQVMSELSADHPFGTNGDPRENQTIIAGRILTIMKHPDLGLLTDDLPLVEGMMTPLAGLTTTISANGSSFHSRAHLGRGQVRELNDQTLEVNKMHMTRGNYVFHIALHGSQVKWTNGYTTKRVMENVSDGTRDMILSHNLGTAAMRKNILVGLTLDCPSFARDGSYSAQDAGVGVVPEVIIPTEHGDFDLFQRALAEHATFNRQPHLPAFRSKNDPDITSERDIKRIQEITLTDLRDAA